MNSVKPAHKLNFYILVLERIAFSMINGTTVLNKKLQGHMPTIRVYS